MTRRSAPTQTVFFPAVIYRLPCGVDEAGRGPLAGAVFAAAVILDPARPISGLADSKVLSPKIRQELAAQIREHALAVCVAQATVEEIDQINILQASLLAMRRAIEGLALAADYALIDGNFCPMLRIPSKAIVAGDALIPAISAASILAKTDRDAYMCELHERYPQYGFNQHMGYATEQHLLTLRTHGACPLHRRTFAPVRQVLGLDFP